jgi:NitT/TauT family transport system permease protein
LLRGVVPPAVVLFLAAAALELFVRARNTPLYLLPRPTVVLQTLFTDRGPLLSALGTTAFAAGLGFLASAAVGMGIAVVLSSRPILRRAFYPYTIFFQTVPIVAIAPLLVFWLDPGLPAVAACAFVVSVFPVIANTLAGLLSTDPALVDLFQLYQAGRFATLWKLRLPFALPAVFTGLRVAAGLAVIGAVVAEFLVGTLGENEGLGVRIVSATRNGRTDRVFAAVGLASGLGLAMFAAVNAAADLALRKWHASAVGD